MKPRTLHRFPSVLIIILLSVSTLFCGCNFPAKENAETFPNQESNRETPSVATDYLVIPLTSGAVSPISACSYDLLHTVCTIQLYDSTDYNLLTECFSVIDKYEKIFSRTLNGSEVYQINQTSADMANPQTSFTISNELKDILEFSLSYGAHSAGALDFIGFHGCCQWQILLFLYD